MQTAIVNSVLPFIVDGDQRENFENAVKIWLHIPCLSYDVGQQEVVFSFYENNKMESNFSDLLQECELDAEEYGSGSPDAEVWINRKN